MDDNILLICKYFFLYLFKANINLQKYKKFLILFLFFFIATPIGYGIDSYIQKDKRTDYPGKAIAAKVQIEWNKNFSNKGDFEVASDHSETINNEKIITKIIMQQLTSEIINFITFSNKN